ncbi:MAG: TetR/AcrR family transcriptional regulator [Puniceicoccales bacterium]
MKRNRAQTEDRIVQAAVDLIVKDGFNGFGINLVATRSGVDKVLIYRYFQGLDGLLAHIATHTEFFPAAATLFPEDDTGSLEAFVDAYRKALRSRPLTRALLSWRTNTTNPLTRAIDEQRQHFWREVEEFAHPGDEAGRAFLSCLRPVLEDSVPDEDILTALKSFAYAPSVPTEAREKARQTAPPEPEEEYLPTNLL